MEFGSKRNKVEFASNQSDSKGNRGGKVMKFDRNRLSVANSQQTYVN